MAKIATFEGTIQVEKGIATVMAVVDSEGRLTIPLVGNLPREGIYHAKASFYRFGTQYALHLRQVGVPRANDYARLTGNADQVKEGGVIVNRTGLFDAEWLALLGDQVFLSENDDPASPVRSESPSPFPQSQRDTIEIVEETPAPKETSAPDSTGQNGITHGSPSDKREDLPPEAPRLDASPGVETLLPSMPSPISEEESVTIVPMVRQEPFPVTRQPEPLLHGPEGITPRVQGPIALPSMVETLPLDGQNQSSPLPSENGSLPKSKAKRSKKDKAEGTKPAAGITAEEAQKFSF